MRRKIVVWLLAATGWIALSCSSASTALSSYVTESLPPAETAASTPGVGLPSFSSDRDRPPTATPAVEPAHEAVPGIDTPVEINGISVRISRVEEVASWEGHTPKIGTRCLVVSVDITSGIISMMDFADWTIYLSDSEGTLYLHVGSMVFTEDGPGEASDGEWVFDVKPDGSSFLFHLPEGVVVPLDSLMPWWVAGE